MARWVGSLHSGATVVRLHSGKDQIGAAILFNGFRKGFRHSKLCGAGKPGIKQMDGALCSHCQARAQDLCRLFTAQGHRDRFAGMFLLQAQRFFQRIVIGLAGDKLILGGSGGVTNGTYYVLTSTNLSAPMVNWTRLLTNRFDASGNFNFTNALNANAPQSFYLLQLP